MALEGCVVLKLMAETQMRRKYPVKSFFKSMNSDSSPYPMAPELAGNSISVRIQALPFWGPTKIQGAVPHISSLCDHLSGCSPGLSSQTSHRGFPSVPKLGVLGPRVLLSQRHSCLLGCLWRVAAVMNPYPRLLLAAGRRLPLPSQARVTSPMALSLL